ncbi:MULTISPECIES: tRNA (cytosine(32)/uridine(32)-2'-O)-methyltransferase TrmJ [unclassified Thalassotalea]|uniref:tRNA (cytosine(32)/uridine(32)-2'-O)-methyltransferase TrmJ n=1 Tax=unclassified Thalassotalea TaxID=2614972 RepID=UPI00108057DE|nr:MULTISPECIES: tRNA (cytosine(32)/uridine(32)-2'-O)-methyltransferase TrmJ [unclassified Thalassotalea]NMP17370.1 tRNA (cytosine(32)/uridine(32)-2'-O)-methyltransferase TrmJ [Thalassotalea sp. Y01]QBY05182.1 tRNA (cytosine(32)/uridine(32)-2'-O)-methyltransferase TrmJ [Thalassotalea sp. HSM 43]
MLDNVRIVLVNTSDCRNMGSAARAMKTMGLKNLYLVDPMEMPNGQAQALAAGATDVLANAKVVSTLEEAITDCGLVVGTSARSRTLPWPMLEPRECGAKMVEEGQTYPVALVFGRESSGLTNDELQLCHYHVCIPANPEYSSLNLAMAVQTLSYEVRVNYLQSVDAQHQPKPEQDSEEQYPLVDETERFYQHFESAMEKTGFIQPKHPGMIMTKVRRLFNRARPDGKELKMLRGILASIDKSVK